MSSGETYDIRFDPSLRLLNDPLEFKRAFTDVSVDELTFSLCFGISRNCNSLCVPVTGIAVGCHIRDMVLGKEIPQTLHRLLVIGHDDIDIGAVLGQLAVDGNGKAAAYAAGNRDN